MRSKYGSRKIGVLLAALFAVSSLTFADTPKANSFPSVNTSCPEVAIGGTLPVSYTYRRIPGNWTSNSSTGLANAIVEWEKARDSRGNQIVELNEIASGTADWTFEFSNFPGESSPPSARTICSSNKVLINIDLAQNSLAFFRGILGHEVGHVFGLDHTGAHSSYVDGKLPVMSTCTSSSSKEWSNDDYSNLTNFQGFEPTVNPDPGGWSGKYEPMNNNTGFESSISFNEGWKKTGGSWWAHNVQQNGQRSLGFNGVRIVNGNQVSNALVQQIEFMPKGNEVITAQASAMKSAVAGARGHVIMQLQVQERDYPDINTNCPTPSTNGLNGTWKGQGSTDYNQLSTAVRAWETVRVKRLKPGNGWQRKTTGWEAISGDAVRVRIRLINMLNDGGPQYEHIYIDNARLLAWK